MTDKSLPNLVKDITYFYIKHFYEKELNTRNLKKLPIEDVELLIENLYVEKANDLKKYIRSTLKENLGDQYSAVAVENIIIEMFNDPTYSKRRVYLEIVDYQNSI